MKTLLFSCIGVLLMLSCSDEVNNYPVGSDFIENDINITLVDTFSVKAGTFKLDSLVTSSTSRLLVGSVNSDKLGKLIAQSYFQVTPASFTIDDDAVYDSIGLVLHYDKYYYGDTTQLQTYKVHRLTEYFEPDEDDAFYNSATLNYDSEPLGQVSFTPQPNKTTDSIYIPLNDALGLEIFNKIRNNEINNSDDFLQYFNGLTVVPDTLSNSHVLGFEFSSSSEIDDNSSLRIFYTEDIDDSSEGNNQQLNFYIPSADKQFNAITENLDGTLIGNFQNTEDTYYSNTTDNQIYAQAGTGISARIELPTLKDLETLSSESAVLNAELKFYPEVLDNSEKKFLKDSLAVYVVDHKNRIVSQLTNIDSAETYALLTQNDDEFNQNTYYTIDMSGFVETILATDYDLNYALMLQFVDYDKTVDHVIINTLDENGNKNIKLTVTYLNY